MLKLRRFTALFAALVLFATPLMAGDLGLGRPALPDEIAAWDKDIRPDGTGLPQGAGTVRQGDEIFAERCAVCHGDFAEGVDRWPALAGGFDSLSDDRPLKTIGSYWPYLSTVYDYVRRAMPFGDAASLSDDEVYALTAYLLYANDILDDEDFELSLENFTSIRLPNEGGFTDDDRQQKEYPAFTDTCTRNCKVTVEITRMAPGAGVTPDEEN
jgi:S-disulfanyl-L-cysteine oxidoreductase SoxD